MSKEDVLDKEIAPLIDQIFELCKKHDIPMLMAFQYEESKFCTSCRDKDCHPSLKKAIDAILYDNDISMEEEEDLLFSGSLYPA